MALELTPTLQQAKSGDAPRTFQVMQREAFEAGAQDVLEGYDAAAAAARRQAAESAREGVRGTPVGSGVRTASARRAAQEMLAPLEDIEARKGERGLELVAQRGEMGNITDDRMLKMKSYEDLIQAAYDEGKDSNRIAQMIDSYIKLEPDPWMVNWLEGRRMGYPGSASLPGGPGPEPSVWDNIESGLEEFGQDVKDFFTF